MNSKTTIYVYNDLGVSEIMLEHTIYSLYQTFPYYEIKLLNANSLLNSHWQHNASLLVMPGGADLPYVAKLNGKGNILIKEYVNQGGSYLGICAGAYYASAYVEFDKDGKYQVLGDRELKFFPDKAIGPILAEFDYFTNSGARAAEIYTNFTNLEALKVYYNGGGYFYNPDNLYNVTVLAKYTENNLAAILKVNYGAGNIILSFVHFEVDPLQLDNQDSHLKELIPELTQDNSNRELLLGEIVKQLIPTDVLYEAVPV